MTNARQDLLTGLRTAFDTWETFLSERTEGEITARRRADEWSISDVIAHMMAWQQVSIARLEAALADSEPVYPGWLGGADPFFAEEHVNEFNARVHAIHRDEAWPSVHRAWRDGFGRFLELGEAIPEEQLLDASRYAWLKGNPLVAVLEGSLEHHQEHYRTVSARMRR